MRGDRLAAAHGKAAMPCHACVDGCVRFFIFLAAGDKSWKARCPERGLGNFAVPAVDAVCKAPHTSDWLVIVDCAYGLLCF
mmetsp:Transcript_43388/g.130131  ORF Transcript_43388/g.130131 Transcript_43388/m.130131 type:complete len:81 (+) Transcript_43388:933-1175(+)|eukprot:358736-Chlamydomonas_euryale.AAC.3